MNTATDLKAIERRLWHVWLEDGLFDIMWSLVFLNFIPAWYLRTLGMPLPFNYLPFVLLGMPIVLLGKRFITKPRLGEVRFSRDRRRRTGLARFVAFGVSLSGVALLVGLTTKSFAIENFQWFGPQFGDFLLLVMLVILPMSLMAWLMEYWQFAVYGTLLVIGNTVAESLRPHIGHVGGAFFGFTITGLALLIYGLCRLAGFLRRYPLPSEKDTHA
jgi:hypothetical protein